MSTSTRVTRSKGESDGLSLPMRMRPNKERNKEYNIQHGLGSTATDSNPDAPITDSITSG